MPKAIASSFVSIMVVMAVTGVYLSRHKRSAPEPPPLNETAPELPGLSHVAHGTYLLRPHRPMTFHNPYQVQHESSVPVNVTLQLRRDKVKEVIMSTQIYGISNNDIRS